MKIKLSTISDVNNFSKACSEYYECDIYVSQGRQIIDGKNILGIISLNLMKPLNVNIITIEHDFCNFIRKWKVGEE